MVVWEVIVCFDVPPEGSRTHGLCPERMRNCRCVLTKTCNVTNCMFHVVLFLCTVLDGDSGVANVRRSNP